MMTTCAANCHQPLNRGEAVIRTNLHEQLAFHPACFPVQDAARPVGGSLGERLARVFAEHRA